jgi:hypothetical protein
MDMYRRIVNPSGVRKSSGLISITAPNTTTTVYQLSTGAGRTARITKIWAINLNTVPSVTLLSFGTGDYTQRTPSFDLSPRIAVFITEDQIPWYIFEANIVAQASAAAAAPNQVLVMIEVEEIGG